jgi:hypothetical protein
MDIVNESSAFANIPDLRSFLGHPFTGNSTAAGAPVLVRPGLGSPAPALPPPLAVLAKPAGPGVHFRREGSSLGKLGLVFKNMEV